MQIDWITVVAQIINFLILVWLLKRFLYAPVVRAMRRREEHIAQRLDEADAKLQEAEEKAKAYEKKHQELDNARDRMMREVREEVDSYRDQLREDMRRSIDEERREWRRQARRERTRFLSDLRTQIAIQFHTVASTALGDLAERSLEEQIAQHLATRLDSLDEEELRSFRQATARGDEEVHVLSRQELTPDAKRKLTRALHQHFGDNLEIIYSLTDELSCGVEIRAAGRSIMWSLDSYLDDFQQNLTSRLEEMEIEKPDDEAA